MSVQMSQEGLSEGLRESVVFTTKCRYLCVCVCMCFQRGHTGGRTSWKSRRLGDSFVTESLVLSVCLGYSTGDHTFSKDVITLVTETRFE